MKTKETVLRSGIINYLSITESIEIWDHEEANPVYSSGQRYATNEQNEKNNIRERSSEVYNL